jgi:hypothetical protein
VTNYHVIKTGSSAIVKLPTGAFFAIDGVLASDKNRDVAVIKAHGENFRTLTLGDSNRLQVGEEVVAIGSPLSLESTVSNGIVSGIRSDDGRRLLQITAPISHGSSGGPLFNLAGEVVGITTAALVGGENLNFAIPINDVKPLLGTGTARIHAFPDQPEDDTTADDGRQSGLSLQETTDWMNKFTVAYARQKNSRAELQFNQCAVIEHNFAGEQCALSGLLEECSELPLSGVFFTLTDVDPTQIRVDGIIAVKFANTNAKRSIDHSGWFMSADWFVIFDVGNKEHAKQFAKAFKHAVDLCGGKASTF